MPTYKIYTDGGAQPNPGIGAYAIVVTDSQNHPCETKCEGELHVTNNQMELRAMLLALNYAQLHPHYQFEIISDSKYVINGLTSWLPNWQTRNWIGAGGQPVKNVEIWQQLASVYEGLSNIQLTWIKGHSKNRFNDAVDKLCTTRIQDIRRVQNG